MEKIIVRGGRKLQGEVDISIAKNSVLPIIVATILNPTEIILKKVPMLEDVTVLINLLRELNCEVQFSSITGDLKINTLNLKEVDPNSELIRKMRASFLVMGPMLARFGRCKISMPGGCNIGSRPVDLHLKGFKSLGIESEIGYGYVEAKVDKLHGNRIYLDFPSVGATENIMMAAILAPGITVIENAAEEPEIWDLARFLNSMGAKIEGAGYGKITIHGVSQLKQPEPFTPIFDRIEAGTFMVAAGITNSKITINGVNEEHLMPTIEKLKECGVYCSIDGQKIIVDGTQEKKPVDIKTMPYPGFPTDMQSIITSVLTIAKGTSIIVENIFENRYKYTAELIKMGAKIKIEGKTAVVKGTRKLNGAKVKSTDLRGGAALVVAGLAAKGKTEVTNIEYVLRGYENLDKKLQKLGAKIIIREGE